MLLLGLESMGVSEIITILIILGFNVLFWAGLVYLIVWLIKRPLRKGKKCPYCAEMIRPEAVVCRYCGRDLPGGA